MSYRIPLSAGPMDRRFFLVGALCLPNVYQKKRESAGKRGFPAFPFSGCLPDVYQGYFFFGKAPFLFTLSGFPLPFLLCKGRYTPLGRLLGENSPVLNEKSAKIQAFSPNNDRCKIMALYSKQVGGRPLNVAMERSTGPLLTVGTGRGSSPACFGFRGEKRSVEIWSERLHRSEGQKI